jgi:hypothetical protein
MFRGRQKGWTWRAVVAGIAAYALALNVIFAGSLGGTIAIAGDDPGGFEICLGHIGASDQQAPALPDTGKLHCVLCVAGIDAPVLPASAAVAMAFARSAVIAADRADDAGQSLAPRDPGKPPTGPPLTA